jgi:hypothetical protein
MGRTTAEYNQDHHEISQVFATSEDILSLQSVRLVTFLSVIYSQYLSGIEKTQFLTDRNVPEIASWKGVGLDGQSGIELMVERAAAGEAPRIN